MINKNPYKLCTFYCIWNL